uniref:(northern house mosquito) hypothetical protein n=1 Tax=Culex pipiens TaxID=7175 RepID=A0A8D8B2J0_CULPI
MVIRFSPKGSFVIRAFQWTKLKHDEVNIRSMGFGFNRDMAGNTHTSALLWAGSGVGAQWGFRKAEPGQPKGRHWDVIIHHDRREVATCHGSRQRDVPIQPAWCQRDATIQSKFNSDKVKVHSG